jgi:hypothetical protein
MPTLRTPAEQGTRVRRLAGMRRPGYQVLEWGLDQDVIGRRTRTGIGGPIGEVRFSAFDHRCQLRATEQAGRPAAQHDEPAQLPSAAITGIHQPAVDVAWPTRPSGGRLPPARPSAACLARSTTRSVTHLALPALTLTVGFPGLRCLTGTALGIRPPSDYGSGAGAARGASGTLDWESERVAA